MQGTWEGVARADGWREATDADRAGNLPAQFADFYNPRRKSFHRSNGRGWQGLCEFYALARPDARPDFMSSNEGAVILLTPLTDEAGWWMVENVPESSGLLGQPVPVEGRYFLDIARGLLEDGLTLQDVATGAMAQMPA